MFCEKIYETLKPLNKKRCRWKFHTMKLCSRLYSTEIEFLSEKPKKSVFEPPFWELRDNVRTPSIAHWKARGRFPIRHN